MFPAFQKRERATKMRLKKYLDLTAKPRQVFSQEISTFFVMNRRTRVIEKIGVVNLSQITDHLVAVPVE